MAEMTRLRCSVCFRILGITPYSQPGTTYCPDRLCYLYPGQGRGSGPDPTLPAYVLAVVELKVATRNAAGKAFDGKRNAYLDVPAQQKLWRTAG